MRYSIWDVETTNRLGRFESEEEALAFVRTMLATYPREKLLDLSLSWRDENDEVVEPVTGEALLDRAEKAVKQQPVTAGSRSYSGSSLSSGAEHSVLPMAASSKRAGK